MQAIKSIACAGLASLGMSATALATPQYDIIDLGVIDPGDFGSQSYGISAGGVAFGRSLGVSNQAWTWSAGTGVTALGNLAGRTYHEARGANSSGQAVGIATTTAFGAGALPVLWNNGVATQLDLLAGMDVGRAYSINAGGTVVGSMGGGISERAVIWRNGTPSAITATTAGGSYMTTAYGINDAGLVVGTGIDPSNAARNVGLLYDSNTNTTIEIPPLAGDNGMIAFNIGNGGHVVGSSSFNQSGSNPFVWDAVNGTIEIPLPDGTSQGSARGVNSAGWTVGIASGAFAVPFLFDGTETFTLQDLIDPTLGWDISMNTSSSAMGISDDGTIVGTGVHDGEIHAYAMVLVPAPSALGVLALGGIAATRRRR